jgi:hypothetical protein
MYGGDDLCFGFFNNPHTHGQHILCLTLGSIYSIWVLFAPHLY